MFRISKHRLPFFQKILLLNLILTLLPILFLCIYNYLLVSKAYKSNSESQVENQLHNVLQERRLAVEKEAESIHLKIQQTESNLEMIRRQAEYLFNTQYEIPNRELHLIEDEKGYLWEPYNNRYLSSNVFVSAKSKNLSNLNEELLIIKEMNTIFKETYTNSMLLHNIWFCHANSAIIAYPAFNFKREIDSGEAPADLDVNDFEFYSIADSTNNPNREIKWTEPYDRFTAYSWVISATAPVYSNDRKLLGVIGFDLPLEFISQSIGESGIKESKTVSFLVNANENIVSIPSLSGSPLLSPTEALEQQLKELHIGIDKDHLLKKIQANPGDISTITIDAETYYIISEKISSSNWLYNVLIPAKQLIDPIENGIKQQEEIQLSSFLNDLLSILLVTLVFTTLISYFYSRKVTKPIKTLSQAIESLPLGNYNPIPITSNDEIGDLTDSFNRLSATIQTLLSRLSNRAFQLKEKTEELEGKNIELEANNEKLEELKTARTELLVQLSHDLKTPMTSIKGLLEVLSTYHLSREKQEELIDIILKKMDFVTELIDNLYELTTHNSAEHEYNMEYIAIDMLVDHSIELASMQAYDLRIEIEKKYQDNLPIIYGDPKHLNRAFYNLLINSIKYSKNQDMIHIIVRVYSKEETIMVEIEDNGIGISNENLPKVFSKYFRENRQETKGIGGNGLGMVIAKQIIERHNGNISIKSQVNKGTTLFIQLPCDMG
ncbi:ATP-binding protein [Fredinandcohnia humi]